MMEEALLVYELSRLARLRGEPGRVFDWVKAARYIVEHGITDAEAGLSGDLDFTGGTILKDGAPVRDDGNMYLFSMWAKPVLVVDGEEIECWSFAGQVPYTQHTKWPDEALAILERREGQ